MVKKTSARLQSNGGPILGYANQDDYLDEIIGDASIKEAKRQKMPGKVAQQKPGSGVPGGVENDSSSEDDNFFAVERIIDKRQKGKRVQYLVKWENYGEEANTWEPVSNLRNVKDLIVEFEKKIEMQVNINNQSSSTCISNHAAISSGQGDMQMQNVSGQTSENTKNNNANNKYGTSLNSKVIKKQIKLKENGNPIKDLTQKKLNNLKKCIGKQAKNSLQQNCSKAVQNSLDQLMSPMALVDENQQQNGNNIPMEVDHPNPPGSDNLLDSDMKKRLLDIQLQKELLQQQQQKIQEQELLMMQLFEQQQEQERQKRLQIQQQQQQQIKEQQERIQREILKNNNQSENNQQQQQHQQQQTSSINNFNNATFNSSIPENTSSCLNQQQQPLTIQDPIQASSENQANEKKFMGKKRAIRKMGSLSQALASQQTTNVQQQVGFGNLQHQQQQTDLISVTPVNSSNNIQAYQQKQPQQEIEEIKDDQPIQQQQVATTIIAECKGSFETDIPERVYSAKMSKHCIEVTIEWQVRADGVKPLPTQYSNNEVKERCPKLLVDFYESRINARSRGGSSQGAAQTINTN
eukprot:403368972